MLTKSSILFWLRNCVLSLALCAGLMPVMGCAMLGAVSNPKVAKALNEDASMYVVLRRSTTAEKIADGVDAAMSKAPGEGDDGWMATLAEPTDALKDEMTKASKRHHYAAANAPIRVLPSEGWAKVLTDAVQKGTGKTLFAMIGGSLVDQYQAVADLKKQVGDLKGKIEDNKIEMKKDGESDDDKNRLSKENDDLNSQVDKLEEKVDPLMDKLIDAARDSAGKAQLGGDGTKVVKVVARLRQAIDDAKTSNGSALVGYPRAIPGLQNTLRGTVISFVLEYIEEKTGKVVDTSKVDPQVTLDGTTPNITINGLGPDDLGKLSIGELTSAVLDKTKQFVSDAFALPARVGRVGEMLTLEGKILNAMQDGLKSEGLTPPDLKDIEPIQVTPAGAAKGGTSASRPPPKH
jgi:hypothetical protein